MPTLGYKVSLLQITPVPRVAATGSSDTQLGHWLARCHFSPFFYWILPGNPGFWKCGQGEQLQHQRSHGTLSDQEEVNRREI